MTERLYVVHADEKCKFTGAIIFDATIERHERYAIFSDNSSIYVLTAVSEGKAIERARVCMNALMDSGKWEVSPTLSALPQLGVT